MHVFMLALSWSGRIVRPFNSQCVLLILYSILIPAFLHEDIAHNSWHVLKYLKMPWEILGKAVFFLILFKLFRFARSFLRAFVFPIFGWKLDLKPYGAWAVVTGATDGIGKSYAVELAKQGFKLVIISRSQEKLNNVKEEISKTYKVEVKTIAFDFSAVSGHEKIENEIKNLDIGILVNNVGVLDMAGYCFHQVPVDLTQKMLTVNLLSAVKMTHMVLKGMLSRKRGILIFVSSSSAIRPVPLMTAYSSTKAFLDFFGRALQIEYADQGIISQVVLPAFVATKMSSKQPSLFVPPPDIYVQQALRTVGIETRTPGCWTHRIQQLIGSAIPSFILDKALMQMAKIDKEKEG